MRPVPLLRPARLAGVSRRCYLFKPLPSPSDRSLTQAPRADLRSHMTMPALVFSRSQSFASQTNSDQTEDYVEDSEPEREARRLREKACRKKTRSIVRPRPTGEVIELSDSGTSSASLAQSSPAHTHAQPLIVVDISGTSAKIHTANAALTGGSHAQTAVTSPLTGNLRDTARSRPTGTLKDP